MCCWPLLVLWALLPRATAGDSGRTFPHRTVLDAEGKYWLSWGPRDSRLAFRLEVRTAGYVGFGFSPTGAMAAADIVVGGVAQGRPYLQVSASTPGVRPAKPGPVPSPILSRPRSTRGSRPPGATASLCGGGWTTQPGASPRTLPLAVRHPYRPGAPATPERKLQPCSFPPPLSSSEFSPRET